jgi:hypothetical protein
VMKWRWRLRTMLIFVAISTVITWGVYLRRRSDAFRGLASREAGIKAKLLEMALDADVKATQYKKFAESLARGGMVSVYETNDPRMRKSNRAFLAEAAAWWPERAAEFRSQAADHGEREARFLRIASRPWESLSPESLSQDADRLRRIALEHADREVFCRDWADSCRADESIFTDMSQESPADTTEDRRAEFANTAEVYARQSKEGLIQSVWHTTMRRKYLRAASHPGESVPPDSPNPNLR